jgi:hypothetical protein
MTFGNLYFTREGKVQMIFPDVGDPNAVKRLVQTLAKEFRQANVSPLEEACGPHRFPNIDIAFIRVHECAVTLVT